MGLNLAAGLLGDILPPNAALSGKGTEVYSTPILHWLRVVPGGSNSLAFLAFSVPICVKHSRSQRKSSGKAGLEGDPWEVKELISRALWLNYRVSFLQAREYWKNTDSTFQTKYKRVYLI